jgi:hypothetical protein
MVGDCGLVFPGADPGFQVIGDVLKKFRLAKRGATILGVFCVKNQDFMPKIIFFPILGGGAGCASPSPLNPPLVPVLTTIVRRFH